jgi:hypothetical protein
MTTTHTLSAVIDAHTGLGVNRYGCVCGWKNPDGTDAAQMKHAADEVRKAIHTPEATEAARREVRALLPALPVGLDVTVAIAALDGGLRARLAAKGCDGDETAGEERA